MGLFSTIRRHAAMASGNFATLFKGVEELPKLPEAVLRLLAELNSPEPDMRKLETIIESVPGLVINLLKMVNSARFGLRTPVHNVQQAKVLLGLKQVKQICLAYTLMDSLPRPDDAIFDYNGLWVDSLLKAMLARELTVRIQPGMEEEAFTAALLTDISLPILMTAWSNYYTPVLEEWRTSTDRLSLIEREHFGWDHSQASAWLLKSWGFSEEIICYVGAHSLDLADFEDLGLAPTVALPVAAAVLLPSVIRFDSASSGDDLLKIVEFLPLEVEDLTQVLTRVEERSGPVIDMFGFPRERAKRLLVSLLGGSISPGTTLEE